ncbi:MAG TPA: phage portal protein [Alphaproteobacteria bacterium]|nr:phage portal protein [Alphaproteobacteria bacterium]
MSLWSNGRGGAMARADGARATPLAPGLVARAAEGVRYIISGVKPGSWFSPSQPLPPQAPPETKGREFDYPVGFNIQARPRAYEALGFAELRGLAESWDLLRLVIETRKDQLEALDWAIRPRSAPLGGNGDSAAIAAVTAFFERPDRSHDWAQWLRALLEDLFVIDAPTLYKRRDRAGRLYALELIDGATIKPLIDASGRRPLPPDPAYQQVLKGVPAVDYTADELIYAPRNLRAHKVYGFSPVEQVVMSVNIALRRAVFQLSYYTEGSVPEALIGVPASWTVDQIRQFQSYWDALLAGELGERRRVRFIPGDMKYQATKAPALKDDYDEWLARIVCFAFSVSPEPFIAHLNRATAETAHGRALEEGLAPLQKWVKRLIDAIIAAELGQPALEFAWVEDREQDPQAAAEIETAYVRAGIKSINESRAALGLAPVPGGEAPMVYTGQGYVALGAAPPTAAGGEGGSPLRSCVDGRRPRSNPESSSRSLIASSLRSSQ